MTIMIKISQLSVLPSPLLLPRLLLLFLFLFLFLFFHLSLCTTAFGSGTNESKIVDKNNFCLSCHEMKQVYLEYSLSAHNNKATCTDCHLPEKNIIKKWLEKSKSHAQLNKHILGIYESNESKSSKIKMMSNLMLRLVGSEIPYASFLLKYTDNFYGSGEVETSDEEKEENSSNSSGYLTKYDRNHTAGVAIEKLREFSKEGKGCQGCHNIEKMMEDNTISPFGRKRHAAFLLEETQKKACVDCHTNLVHSVSGVKEIDPSDERELPPE